MMSLNRLLRATVSPVNANIQADGFKFDVHTTQVVSMNKLPYSFDKTKGFYRRLALVFLSWRKASG